MGLTDYVILDVAGFTGDIHPDANYLLAGEGEGQGVFLARNLVKGFLGYRSDTDLSLTGTYGFIWTRELNVNDNQGADVLYIYAGGIINRNGDNRYYGIPVRGVQVLSE